MTSIYLIWNTVTNHAYVGSTKCLPRRRFTNHMSKLRNGTHCNSFLQSAFNCFGEMFFRFAVIDECEDWNRKALETSYIFLLGLCDGRNGYNLAPFSGASTKGIHRSDAFREKLRAANLGKKRAPFSDEWRANLSKASRGKPRPWQVGKKHSEEERRKMSLANKGKTLSAEHKAKIAAARKGFHPSEETCRKMSASRMGRIITPEWAKKISEANKRTWALKRAAVAKVASGLLE